MSTPVVTRFAPSPTGYLHIGGLRTALFSYLMARRNGGKFILRVEDTDRSRFVEDSVKDIEESLRWAGLDWDEGPIFQSDRLPLYQEHADKLLQAGHAYKCFCSPERLTEVRERKVAAKENPGYDRHCRDLTTEKISEQESQGIPFVIRLRMPTEGSITVHDIVRGEMSLPVEQLEDIIIVKGDGFPTYHLAHVVDDTLMGVTHVFRGTEWIPTAPMHAFMCEALSFPRLTYVHLPLILSPDGGKLSKRHGATNVKEFIEQGYTREGLLNFLALLGWSLDDRTELFTLEELEQVFDPKRISKSPAVFSYDKLNHFNNHYIKAMPLADLLERANPFLDAKLRNELAEPTLAGLIDLYRDRINTITELNQHLAFALDSTFACPAAAEFELPKTTLADSAAALGAVKKIFETDGEWNLDRLNDYINTMSKETGLKKPQIFMPLRLAITGTKNTPSIVDIAYHLGPEACCRRIDMALQCLGISS